jgi:small conductance mechanosensitive channel
MGLFSEGRFLGKILDEWTDDAQEFIHIRLPHLLMVALIAFVLSRLLHLITARMIHIAEQHAPAQARVSQVRTLAGVIRTTGLAVIGLIVSLQFLDAVGVNLAPLLTSAGIAGVAVGLAAQNIVRDMLNGVLILIEDQFNVGDTVRLAGLSGVVEAMTLRKTTVRDNDGTLYVIPNSQITTVANQSRDYSTSTINVNVDFSANPDQVIELLKSVAAEVRASAEFGPVFVADPQILGVEAIKGSELVFLVIFKTLATQQYGALREFRRRLRLALAEKHLLPGDPNRVFLSFDKQVASTNKSRADQAIPAPDPTLLKPREGNPFGGS